MPMIDLEALAAEQRDRLAEDGYSIMPDALPPSLCDAVQDELARMAGSWDRTLVQAFHGFETIRYFDLLNAAAVFQEIPIAHRLLAVARAVLGDDCLLSTYGTVAIGPGEKAQVIHADDGVYGLRRPHPEFYLNVIVALDDFTEANGATRIVPGSHREAGYPPLDSATAEAKFTTVAAEMPRGSACFVLGSTYHGGGENKTDAYRHGMTMAYVSGWARPQENFFVAVSQDRAASFDPELQAVMGYRTGRGRLGHIFTQPERFSGPMAHKLARDPSLAPAPGPKVRNIGRWPD